MHPRCYPLIWTPERIALWKATGKRPAIGVWTAAHLYEFLEYTRPDGELGLLWRVVGLRGCAGERRAAFGGSTSTWTPASSASASN